MRVARELARPFCARDATGTDEWATPSGLFAELDREFRFELDACATAATAKCRRYWTIKDDGLRREWHGAVWCNPPYGRRIGAWLAKAADAARRGSTVVCLVPAKTDTAWWHDGVIGERAEVRFLRGRVRFGDGRSRAPFPSAVVIFRCPVPPRLPVGPEHELATLLGDVLAVAKRGLTVRGHLAMQVDQENLGICNCRVPRGDGCAASCVEARETIARAERELTARGVDVMARRPPARRRDCR